MLSSFLCPEFCIDLWKHGCMCDTENRVHTAWGTEGTNRKGLRRGQWECVLRSGADVWRPVAHTEQVTWFLQASLCFLVNGENNGIGFVHGSEDWVKGNLQCLWQSVRHIWRVILFLTERMSHSGPAPHHLRDRASWWVEGLICLCYILYLFNLAFVSVYFRHLRAGREQLFHKWDPTNDQRLVHPSGLLLPGDHHTKTVLGVWSSFILCCCNKYLDQK